MTKLVLDEKTAERMGYEGVVAATTLMDRVLAIEFALVPPGQHISGSEWVVIIHSGCDPENPDHGSSGVEPCGNDRVAAEAYYLHRIEETAMELDDAAGASFGSRP